MTKKKTIQIINPNSSVSVTEGMEAELKEPAKNLNVNLEYVTFDKAPPAIESPEDVKIAHEMVEDYIGKANADAYVVACFCDPGVDHVRSNGHQNVFGIGESAMHLASLMGKQFGIISILDVSVERHREQILRAGLITKLAGDLAVNMGVLELEKESAWPNVEKVGRKLVKKHNAGSIILGCAGMGVHRQKLQDTLNIPVIDPCWAGLAMAAGAVGVFR